MATKKAAPAPKSAPAKGKAKETAKAKDTKATKKAAAKPAPKKVAKPVVKLMTKTELVDRLAAKSGGDSKAKAQAKAILDELVVVAAEEAKKGGFMLPGLGKFVFREVKERQGRHPGTGEPITIPGGQKLKFVISETIKKAVQE
ncbi:MAG: HU family DNA-binding protein [Acidobacteria bacterium]|nr:HU family DNA-binding protein [Acidobacteriota bacterium]